MRICINSIYWTLVKFFNVLRLDILLPSIIKNTKELHTQQYHMLMGKQSRLCPHNLIALIIHNILCIAFCSIQSEQIL